METTTSDSTTTTPAVTEQPPPAPTSDPPQKSKRPVLKADERKRCWAARDGYFTCFDKKGQNKAHCEKEFAQFEKDCPKKWMEHFEGIRMKAAFRKAMVTEGVGYKTYESEKDMALDDAPAPVYYDEKPLGDKK